MLSQMQMDEVTRNNLILAEGIFASSCNLIQKLANEGSLRGLFRSPRLRQLAMMLESSPELLQSLVDAILNEDLHRFIVNNQLPDIIADFPSAFCDEKRKGNFLSFVNGSAMRETVRGVCNANWSVIIDDLVTELIPTEIYVRMADRNSTFDLVRGGTQNFLESWYSFSSSLMS